MHDIELSLYLRSLATRPWLGMLSALDAELVSNARLPAHEADVEFMRFLVATRVYLLGEGLRRPPVLDDAQFLQLKPLCEALVSQGRFSAECLKLFDGLQPWHPPKLEAATGAGQRR